MTFRLPPYPYDRLDGLAKLAEAHPRRHGRLLHRDALRPAAACRGRGPGHARGPSAAIPHRPAARSCARRRRPGWQRRFGIGELPVTSLAACVGTKELVASVPHILRLRQPDRDTVLYPAISYPTYAMGAELAGCRAVAVPAAPGRTGGLDLEAIDPEDAARALVLWSNSPSNPTGGLGDLGCRGGLGQGAGRSGLLGRVLRRVHLGRPAALDARVRHRRRRGRALVVEAVQPGRRPGGFLRG